MQPEEGDHSDLLWEMQTLAKFNHPHVVAFYHHFSEENCLYLVMEFCAAGSLDDRLVASGRFPEERVFGWGVELCDSLAFVHDKGIVHHDIKPQNILFAEDETIKLGDFGVANRNIGTRLYVPPEMILGERLSPTDPRVDVYSLGLTLLESLIGRHPFGNLTQLEAVHARIAHDFVPSDLSRWVQEVLLKATHPTPEMRFQSAKDFGDAIRGRHVPYVFDGDRIKADAWAMKAEAAIRRRKWRKAERLAADALDLCPDCVTALMAAGRCHLLLRRIDRARDCLSKAVAVSPRTPVQKELGWISLEQSRLPTAISLLTDHLQRNASDYEAYNLLLKCFYLTDRWEAAEAIADILMAEEVPNTCFRSNEILCRILRGDRALEDLDVPTSAQEPNPFIVYNLAVFKESPRAWNGQQGPPLKTKLLFQEYQFGAASRTGGNTVVVHTPDDERRRIETPIITIGSMDVNDIVLKNRNVSRRHCVIVNYPGDVWLYDLGSTVGSTVDGEPVAGRTFLDGVHEVKVGPVSMRVASSPELLI